MGFLGLIGFIVSLVASGFMLIGFIPFLGWLNWFTTLPASLAGTAICGLGLSKGRNGLAVAGLVISLIVFVLTIGRLFAGCGVF